MKKLRILFLMAAVVVVSQSDIRAGSEAQAKLDFYGHQLSVIFDQGLQKLKLPKLDQSEFNTHSKYFRNQNLKRTANMLKRHSQFYDLDDIGNVLLIDKFTDEIFSNTYKNEKTLVKYLILKEMDYDVILTRTGSTLNCLGNLSYNPGRYLFISYNNISYKDLDFKKRSTGTQHFIFVDTKKTYNTFSRNVLKTPKINALIREDNIQFVHNGTLYLVPVKANVSIQQFLADLPMYKIGREYTRLPVSQEMESSLVNYLKKITKGMDRVEAATLLLSFVQQVVPYGSDYEKYNEECYYYPEQTVGAVSADCEDKAFLMSYLSRKVLNMNSVSLYFQYDEHVTIGLDIPEFESVYSFKYKGKNYVACEPTAKSPRLGYTNFNLTRVTELTYL